eukprot:jgi/Chrzof1/4408/Cz14g12020.t1
MNIRPAGWQLIAGQVANAGQTASTTANTTAAASPSHEQDGLQRKSTQAPLRSFSNSFMSEDSASSSSNVVAVATRPHQWLYKEYKVLEEIGSGGFGRVCRWA